MSDLDLSLFLDSRGIPVTSLTEVQRETVRSALIRGDRHTAARLLGDWNLIRKVTISRFEPGRHYHVLGEKFDSIAEARAHAERLGFTVIPGVAIRYVPGAE